MGGRIAAEASQQPQRVSERQMMGKDGRWQEQVEEGRIGWMSLMGKWKTRNRGLKIRGIGLSMFCSNGPIKYRF